MSDSQEMSGESMRQARLASLVAALLLASMSAAPAQEVYNWQKYTLPGYGAIDMGYFCDNSQLSVAIHGEANGSLSVALGDDAPKTMSFDGRNGMGPDGYYTQAVVAKSVQCDNRGTWPVVRIAANGKNLNIRWQ
jgi:hypothetical protein